MNGQDLLTLGLIGGVVYLMTRPAEASSPSASQCASDFGELQWNVVDVLDNEAQAQASGATTLGCPCEGLLL